jgi:hypothetical protein
MSSRRYERTYLVPLPPPPPGGRWAFGSEEIHKAEEAHRIADVIFEQYRKENKPKSGETAQHSLSLLSSGECRVDCWINGPDYDEGLFAADVIRSVSLPELVWCEVLMAMIAPQGRVEEAVGDHRADLAAAVKAFGPRKGKWVMRGRVMITIAHRLPAISERLIWAIIRAVSG